MGFSAIGRFTQDIIIDNDIGIGSKDYGILVSGKTRKTGHGFVTRYPGDVIRRQFKRLSLFNQFHINYFKADAELPQQFLTPWRL
jgi:hypothetical protein